MTTTDRVCRDCRQARSAESFASDAPSARCKPCRQRISDKRDRVALRAMNLWTKYRITLGDYEALLAAQDHRCAICRKHEDEIVHSRGGRQRLDGSPPTEAFKLVVDHCHTTGRVRGLLCNGCNFLVGQAGESERVMLAAIEYLKREPSFESSVQALFAG